MLSRPGRCLGCSLTLSSRPSVPADRVTNVRAAHGQRAGGWEPRAGAAPGPAPRLAPEAARPAFPSPRPGLGAGQRGNRPAPSRR